MGEYVDLYNESKELIGKKVFREKGKKAVVPEGFYTIVVLAFIENSKGEVLVQKASARKNGVYAIPGGHVKAGQSSLEGIKEELLEEMNLIVQDDEISLIKIFKYNNAFKDVYYIKKDIDIYDLKLQEDEVDKVCYLSIKEIEKLISNNDFRSTNIDALKYYYKI